MAAEGLGTHFVPCGWPANVHFYGGRWYFKVGNLASCPWLLLHKVCAAECSCVCVCVCFEVLTLVALERWGLNEVLKTYSGPSDDLHVYLWATVSSHRESNTGNMFYMHHSFPTVPAFSPLLPLPCFSKCVFYSSQAFLEWFYGKQGWFNDLSSAGG